MKCVAVAEVSYHENRIARTYYALGSKVCFCAISHPKNCENKILKTLYNSKQMCEWLTAGTPTTVTFAGPSSLSLSVYDVDVYGRRGQRAGLAL